MSQDIQVSSMNNLPMQSDYFPSGGNMGGPAPQGGSPLAKLHRLLRGRYPIVVVLALIFGAVGGAAGYLSQKPLWAATGTIEVSPYVKTIDNIDKVQPMFAAFMRVQMEVLHSPKLVQAAIETDVWKDDGKRDSSSDAVGTFIGNLLIDNPKNSNLLTITYNDLDKKSAEDGVKALVEAYRSVQNDMEQNQIVEDIKNATARKEKLEGNIRDITTVIQELGSRYGSIDLTNVHSQKIAEQSRIQTKINELTVQLETYANAPGVAGPTTKPAPRITADELATKDPSVRILLNALRQDEIELELNRDKYGPNHPWVNDKKAKIGRERDMIEKRIDAYMANPTIDTLNMVDGQMQVQPISPQTIRNNIAAMQKQLELVKKETQEVGTVWMKIQSSQSDLSTAQGKLKNVMSELEGLDFRLQTMGRINVINDGTGALPASDKRNMVAAAGLLGGMAVPVGLMLLIGLMDSRLRYSDETDTDLSGITLLGILPNLPDRLSDPEQAATAAHCVHQIRTMLQINGAATEQSVFAVTSASPGDGKTSLTLALGLSFAACGSRTLLIDCDLIGAGLTRRLGVNAETGILEAANTRTILEHIRTTEIADVAILPVGAAGTMHASTLSPNSLRRIIQEAKKHFDVIMIDTGPILGSIEASLVATVADGIVLTVARGQHRGMVEKSLRHLMGIGAKISGVVFNRAQARDFERSLSNMSMRSVGLIGNVNGENRYGPLGRAVQGSVNK